MGVVVFDWAAWAAAYPSFELISEEQATMAFQMAEQYCNNTDGSPVGNLQIRQNYLWLLTCHIVKLLFGENGEQPSDIVGRVSNASEGSVSVSTGPYGDGMQTPGMEWYTQTKYGAMYWQLTAIYRSARYYPGPQRFYQAPGLPSWPV